ncbi:MAG: hypothetical protein PVI66_07755 [Candidatus Aminicenantes bacterium]|jgi:hypothetical protein
MCEKDCLIDIGLAGISSFGYLSREVYKGNMCGKMPIKQRKNKQMPAYRGFLYILVTLIVLGSCNFGTPDYKLNVTLEEGVTGTPQQGEHFYKDLASVDYEYTAIDPIHTVEVSLNGIRQPSSGTFTMYTDVELIARMVDIRGSWHVEMFQLDPSETFEFDITIAGAGLTNGTFSDSRNYHGTWIAENGVITMTYTDWSSYVLTGSLYEMSGTFSVNGEDNGGWEAERLE